MPSRQLQGGRVSGPELCWARRGRSLKVLPQPVHSSAPRPLCSTEATARGRGGGAGTEPQPGRRWQGGQPAPYPSSSSSSSTFPRLPFGADPASIRSAQRPSLLAQARALLCRGTAVGEGKEGEAVRQARAGVHLPEQGPAWQRKMRGASCRSLRSTSDASLCHVCFAE